MKLYTEEQVRNALKDAMLRGMRKPSKYESIVELMINDLTPIELPSDDEIGKLREEHIPIDEEDLWSERFYFTIGAKAMRDKIQGGNKWKNY